MSSEEIQGWRRGAEQGDAAAQFSYGLCLAAGNGAMQSWTAAARLWRQAAEQGYAPALLCYGMLCMEGGGVPQDLIEAVRNLRIAADHGEGNAFSWLGYLCECGKGGMKRDLAEAARLYSEAVERGNYTALAQVAVFFEKGRGIAQSDEAAAEFYAKASELGGAGEALFNMALIHLAAISERNAPEAFTIQLAVRDLALAARLGHAGAIAKLASISSRREVASACCMGCGATRKLLSCGKCGIARSCDRACQLRTWPMHKPSCQQWRDEGSSAPTRDSEEEEEVMDLASLPIKEIKRRLDRLKINYAGVLERAELVALLENA